MNKWFIGILLCAHLLLLCLGTDLFDFGKVPRRLRPFVLHYLALCGGHPYAFFSPEVPKEILVECRVLKSDGQIEIIRFGSGASSTELRETYLYQFLNNSSAIETTGPLLAAHYCFLKYPMARSVQVSIRILKIPTIAASRAGTQASMEELVHQDFAHDEF